MKAAGIIVEYNPFHKGHEYHIAETRRVTGADFVVAVMSGNFTQRGIPACFDKFTRAECALACGADVVLELPFCYATGSAEYFAEGAVMILDKLGCVDSLCFGTEADV
ncbi:MAG: nucleotidyltransferase family protein, partial [Lachnospiraceae bacterium]|nr:nucleotidyltransferase family protein [Lachnospiraceae bacterium]